MATEGTGPVCENPQLGETREGMIMGQDKEGHGGRVDPGRECPVSALLAQVPDLLFALRVSFFINECFVLSRAHLEQHRHLRFWKGVYF